MAFALTGPDLAELVSRVQVNLPNVVKALPVPADPQVYDPLTAQVAQAASDCVAELTLTARRAIPENTPLTPPVMCAVWEGVQAKLLGYIGARLKVDPSIAAAARAQYDRWLAAFERDPGLLAGGAVAWPDVPVGGETRQLRFEDELGGRADVRSLGHLL